MLKVVLGMLWIRVTFASSPGPIAFLSPNYNPLGNLAGKYAQPVPQELHSLLEFNNVSYSEDDILAEEAEIRNFLQLNSFSRRKDKLPRAHPLYKFLKEERCDVVKLERLQKARNEEKRKQEWRDYFESLRDGTYKPIVTPYQKAVWQEFMQRCAERCEPFIREINDLEANRGLEREERNELQAGIRQQISEIQKEVFEAFRGKMEESGALQAVRDYLDTIPRYLLDLSQPDFRNSIYILPRHTEVPADITWEVSLGLLPEVTVTRVAYLAAEGSLVSSFSKWTNCLRWGSREGRGWAEATGRARGEAPAGGARGRSTARETTSGQCSRADNPPSTDACPSSSGGRSATGIATIGSDTS